ncbi:enoyl-CoA hydratase-related protein [Shimia sp.]|uniref:enoyl-CoA hydratase-related protein n=1 Tax=Shimia sp. TaxID=1954381 RepID=UPI003BAD0F55
MTDTTTPENGVLTEQLGQVMRITMTAPGKKNAIDKDMYLGLADAFNAAAANSEIRAVWLRGADNDFTSGNVVSGFDQTAKGDNPPVAAFLKALIEFPKPIVAEVEGVAIGIGATMLMHCDLIYVAEGARFRLPFVNLGLVPEAGASYVLPRLMGQAKAAELLLLGRMFDADEALSAGLINQVLPAADLVATVEATLKALCEQPPEAMRLTKAFLRRDLEGTLWDRVSNELSEFAAGLDKDEFKEAYAAFTEKRKPVFK